MIRENEDITIMGTPRPLGEFMKYLRLNDQLHMPSDFVKQLVEMENAPASGGMWCFFGDGVGTVADVPYGAYVAQTASSAASLLLAGAVIAAIGAFALLHALKVF